MSTTVISLHSLGKRYKLYRRPADKVLDTFGINRWLFWRKNYYQEFWALRDLNLEITRGERVGIIGRNGAGKSTLLKIISGNITPTEGTVQVNGQVQALLELGTGFHPEFTGRQNIRVFLSYQGLPPSQIREMEEDIVDFAELDEFIDQPIKTYSSGMYARLAFSSATVVEPELLIIDEILGAGDAYFAGKCVERMHKLTEESGATVLFVSHDLSSVQRLCDRVIWIDRGEMQRSGEPLEVIKAYSAMVRKEEELRLMARELKIRKKQAISLDRHDDIYKNLLFHFVPEDAETPLGCHRIYSLRLCAGEREVGSIHIGSPMDNAEAHRNYVMDDPGDMDWGVPQRDENGTYREYRDLKGKYRHAPFKFAVPKALGLRDADDTFSLEVVAQTDTKNVAIEIHNSEGYLRLGCLPLGMKTTTLALPSGLLLDTASEKPVAADSEPTDNLLFHLAPVETETPLGCHRIYSLRLCADKRDVGSIHVGSPTDNAEVRLNYLIDSPGYMNWGTRQRDENGTYREYLDLKGKYGHAPFEFAVPKTLTLEDGGHTFTLEIVAQTNTENVAIEIRHGEGYLRLGCLPMGMNTTTLPIPSELLSAAACEKPLAKDKKVRDEHPESVTIPCEDSHNEYGTKEVLITTVRMLDQNTRETRVFEMTKPMKIVLEFDARETIANPVFIFCAYLPDGQCATQWVASSKDMGREYIQGRGSVTFAVEDAILGQAAYVASVGIYKHLRSDGLEAESYHVLNRCIHFQILPPTENHLERGLCLQPFRAELQCR